MASKLVSAIYWLCGLGQAPQLWALLLSFALDKLQEGKILSVLTISYSLLDIVQSR